MDPRAGDEITDDHGFASVEFLVAAALSLLLLVWLADFLVVRYAEGVMGAAAHHGARAGSVAGDPAVCAATADGWLDDALGGMRQRIGVACRVSGTHIEATVTGRFDAWLPGAPAWEVGRTVTAVIEP